MAFSHALIHFSKRGNGGNFLRFCSLFFPTEVAMKRTEIKEVCDARKIHVNVFLLMRLFSSSREQLTAQA